MLTQVIVVLDQITHYLVEYPKNAREVRRLVVASGVCNDIPFAATARNDPDFSTHLDLFRRDGGQFSKMEFQSIQRRIKMATPLLIVDWRDDQLWHPRPVALQDRQAPRQKRRPSQH